jgi:hypothetical protein
MERIALCHGRHDAIHELPEDVPLALIGVGNIVVPAPRLAIRADSYTRNGTTSAAGIRPSYGSSPTSPRSAPSHPVWAFLLATLSSVYPFKTDLAQLLAGLGWLGLVQL